MELAARTYLLEVLQELENHEDLIRQLYEAFSRALPEQGEFWLSTAAGEAAHVQIFKSLAERAKLDMLQLTANSSLRKEVVIEANEHMRMYLKEVQEHGISARRAVAIAQQTEDGVLEREMHIQFGTDDEDTHKLLTRLQFDTETHRAELSALSTRRDEYNGLVRKGIITGIQVELARTLAQREHLSTEMVLLTRFHVSKEELLKSLGAHYRLGVFDLERDPPVPADLIDRHKDKYDIFKAQLFLPVGWNNGKVVVAMAHPGDLPLRDDIPHLLGEKDVEFRLAITEDVLSAIDRQFAGQAGREGVLRSVLDELAQEGSDGKPLDTAVEVREDDSIIVRLVNLVIEDAHKLNASDIHIEAGDGTGTLVRYRVDGDLRRAMESPRHYSRAILSRIKIMSGLDIAERRKPQSGKIAFRRWGRLDIELRVEVYPTAGGGEDAVLRILSGHKALPMDQMGFRTPVLDALYELILRPYGLFLCVGPTGSGKTTTLHSILGHLNDETRKILTAEDPVEIVQPGLRQLQVNRRAGLDFAEALRSFLRADPDVIMIGEMRDTETATIGVEASLTGHLVMSTLHTNTAPETVTRLLDMGLDAYSFADALLGVLAQRLVRRLCPACRKPVTETTTAISELRAAFGPVAADFDALTGGAKPVLFQPGGCKECNFTGYKGRAALHELMLMSDPLRALLVKHAPAMDIRQTAVAEGMYTLKQDGIAKVLTGLTTIGEVMGVCDR